MTRKPLLEDNTQPNTIQLKIKYINNKTYALQISPQCTTQQMYNKITHLTQTPKTVKFYLTCHSTVIPNTPDIQLRTQTYINNNNLIEAHIKAYGGNDEPEIVKKPETRAPSINCVQFFLDAQNSAKSWLEIHDAWTTASGLNTSSQKAYSLLSLLPQEYLTKITNLAQILNHIDAYDHLKKATITLTTPRQQDLLQMYFKTNSLGTALPSQYLATAQTNLQSLGINITDDDTVRQLFIAALPPQLQLLMAVVPPSVSLDELAKIADRSIELVRSNQTPPPITAAVTTPTNIEIQALQEETKALKETLSRLTASISQLHTRSSSRSSSPARNRSRTPRPQICYYHHKFNSSANKCHAGCKFFDPKKYSLSPCIYHAKFKGDARRCTQPCNWQSRESNPSLNC